jgi:DNA-binding NtrC family response regulator
LHDHGKRKGEPFAAVNCAAIPADLLESELFGHVKGAFTGASADRTGAFREAHRGTLFLDEIGDMPSTMQAKILRVLQDKVVTPIGGKPTQVDVRVVAATHRNLPELIRQGLFREDLFYRLNVVSISLPPLRERLADIIPLAEHFLRLAAGEACAPKRMTSGLAAQLLRYGWPGNVRELKNALDYAVTVAEFDHLSESDLPEAVHARRNHSGDTRADDPRWSAVERQHIEAVLRSVDGNRARAARLLGIDRRTLHRKLDRLAIDVPPRSRPGASGGANSASK